MFRRIEYAEVAPDALEAMQGLERYVRRSRLEKPLLELVRIRASQINRCAYCLDLHVRNARLAGEDERRLYMLSIWREAPFYSDRERAALAWTEAVTDVSRAGVPDAVYRTAREHFTERELVDLTLTLVTINGWNRIAVAFQREVGGHRARVRSELRGHRWREDRPGGRFTPGQLPAPWH